MAEKTAENNVSRGELRTLRAESWILAVTAFTLILTWGPRSDVLGLPHAVWFGLGLWVFGVALYPALGRAAEASRREGRLLADHPLARHLVGTTLGAVVGAAIFFLLRR